MFKSEAFRLGNFTMPSYTGLRVMMMPFDFNDKSSLSKDQVGGYADLVYDLIRMNKIINNGANKGIGYLTIDEAEVVAGTTHRRPGLHVDGVSCSAYGGGNPYGGGITQDSPYGSYYRNRNFNPYGGGYAPYGGGGSAYASSKGNKGGMILLASNNGTRSYIQNFDGLPGNEGDCEHLRNQCKIPIDFKDNEAWWCSGLCVHEAVHVPHDTKRQILRISMPSNAPYHWPYTKNITGVVPITSPGPDRTPFMEYRT